MILKQPKNVTYYLAFFFTKFVTKSFQKVTNLVTLEQLYKSTKSG